MTTKIHRDFAFSKVRKRKKLVKGSISIVEVKVLSLEQAMDRPFRMT